MDRTGMRRSTNITDVRDMPEQDVLTQVIMNIMQPSYDYADPKGALADYMHGMRSPLADQLGGPELERQFYQQLMEMRKNAR